MHAEADPGYSERGSKHRSVSLMQGAWGTPDKRYRVLLLYYNTKIMRFSLRAYLSKYKELFNQVWSRGRGGCNPLEHIGCFIT